MTCNRVTCRGEIAGVHTELRASFIRSFHGNGDPTLDTCASVTLTSSGLLGRGKRLHPAHGVHFLGKQSQEDILRDRIVVMRLFAL